MQGTEATAVCGAAKRTTAGKPRIEPESTPSDAGRRDAYGYEPETGSDTYDVPAVSVYIFVGNPLSHNRPTIQFYILANPNTPTTMASLLRRSTGPAALQLLTLLPRRLAATAPAAASEVVPRHDDHGDDITR
jgi:hypothetical protein